MSEIVCIDVVLQPGYEYEIRDGDIVRGNGECVRILKLVVRQLYADAMPHPLGKPKAIEYEWRLDDGCSPAIDGSANPASGPLNKQGLRVFAHVRFSRS